LTGRLSKHTGSGFLFHGGWCFMELIRLGDKIISRGKLDQAVNKIIDLRMKGLSQTEVAQRLGIDRTLICRLENLGEIRKGRSLAVVGFPILNKKEVEEALEREGVDLVFIMSEEERWQYIKQKNRIDLFDAIMEKIANVHSFDQVIVIGSNKRIKTFEAVLDKDVIGFEIGESPIQEDKLIKIEDLIELVRAVKK
jgi:transcriptional regulator with XRE-family HTH domain